MATATAKKSKKVVKDVEPFAKITGSEVKTVKLAEIQANSAQSRGMGVLSNLQEMGYGLFERITTDKDSIWNMLFSDNEEVVAHALNLIEENEASLVELANSLRETQLQPIGVYQQEDGSYDCIYGMRRTLATAYNHLKHQTSDEIESKVFTFDRTPTKSQLMLMALRENKDRKDESPIDLAMTYKRLQDAEGMSGEEIGLQIGKSGQHVREYISLLKFQKIDSKILMKIHTGKMKVDPALKILREMKKGKDKDEAEESATEGGRGSGDKNKSRFRLPGTKGLMKILEAKRKPKKVSDELWEFYKMDTVREFLCCALGLRFEPYVEPPPEEEKKPKKKKGEVDENVIQVKRKRAVNLLVALGETNARTYEDAILANKLENIVNLSDENTELESEPLQKLLEQLRKGYEEDKRVEILKDSKE